MKLLKKIAKIITPPLLWQTTRGLLGITAQRPTFEGRYSSFTEIPCAEAYPPDLTWPTSLLASGCGREVVLPAMESDGSRTLLPLLVAACGKDSVSVIDFGGGMALSYRDCLEATPTVAIEYTVVELPAVVNAAGGHLGYWPNLRFRPNLPFSAGCVDIIHAGSSLQYVEDYRGTLERMAALHPFFFLFTDMPVSDGPTFATCQLNIPPYRIPVWIIGMEDIVGALLRCGYALMYSSRNPRRMNCSRVLNERETCVSANLLFARRNP